MIANRMLLATIFLLSLCWAARADDALYLQPPYDEVVLDESNGRAVLRVQPLDFPGRRMPAENDRKEDLEFELVDRPGEKFAVPWVNVNDIRFFERLVLAEADAKAKESRFDEAQPYYLFLQAKYKDTPGLKESIETFLYMQVGGAFRAQRYDEALALLVELYGLQSGPPRSEHRLRAGHGRIRQATPGRRALCSGSGFAPKSGRSISGDQGHDGRILRRPADTASW